MKIIYFFFVLLFFLQSMKMCWLWFIDGGVISALCLLTGLASTKGLINIKITSKDFIVFSTCLIAFLLAVPEITLLILISRIVLSFNIVLLLKWPNNILEDLYQYVYSSLAVILLPSIIFYIFHTALGVSMPYFIQESHELGYVLENHYFYIINPGTFRFCSYFCEPGHLATIMSLFLLCSRCNIKDWRTIVIIVAILLSFSLAGYVIAVLAFVVKFITVGNFRNVIKNFTITLSIFLILVFIFKIIGKYEILDELIFQRLIFDSETGKLSGDNRVSYNVDLFIESLNFQTLFWGGINTEKYDLYGTGVKMYILHFGVIGLTTTFFMYYMILRNRSSFYGFLCLIVFSISFIQRCYALWFCQIFMFIYCVALGYKIKNYEKHNILNNNSK